MGFETSKLSEKESKCPRCSSEKLEFVKEWDYGKRMRYHAKLYKCNDCNKTFQFQRREDGVEFTIPSSSKAKEHINLDNKNEIGELVNDKVSARILRDARRLKQEMYGLLVMNNIDPESSHHDQIKNELKVIGEFLGFIGKCEKDERLDCSWWQEGAKAAKVVFEVQDKGSLDKAIRKLETVRKYGGRTYLVCTLDQCDKAKKEIGTNAKIIKDDQIELLFIHIAKAKSIKEEIGLEW